MRTRTAITAAICSLGLVLPAAAAADSTTFPETIPLPVGFQPEGIAAGPGSTFYAGSLATGAVVRGDLRTGELQTLVAGATGPAVGIAVDAKQRVWVAGGPTGEIRVYDGGTGALLGSYAGGGGFINDLVVTRDAVYATNSFAPILAVVPLGPGGSLPADGPAEQLPLIDFPSPGLFNANGIEEGRDGRLIVANLAAGALYAVAPTTGQADQIDLGQALPNVDGITARGGTLYAVQNQLNQIAVIRLAPDLSSGRVVDTLTNPDFDIPTTVALFGDATYVVNARFGNPSPGTATYDAVRTDRH